MEKVISFVWEHFVKPGGSDFATYSGDANAPTLYDYDKDGFIKPSEGRQVTNQEQQQIDEYNKQRAALNDIERQQLDAEIQKILPNWGTEPRLDQPILNNWKGSEAGGSGTDDWSIEEDFDFDLPAGKVSVGPMTPSPSDMDGTDYHQDGTSYQ